MGDYLPAEDELAIPVDRLVTLYSLFRDAVAVGGPEFGTMEWLALEAGDPRREAALVRASYSWVAAEVGVGAPASRERLDRVVREEVAEALSEASSEVAGLAADPAAWRREQEAYVAREVAA